ncbi:hypothetical protein FHT00_000187 [Sphingomonas insulae]|uniref:Uncharacterized protein n=1 Tax=Sphingomonas insulae TaxID=424800 RepID=A0ABN1HUH2_9SPHN|nr:hypothetical protein [Sphingomonas insulae]NIJ28259.1 hypothetical protein [Sphingomonas insulae]
MKPLLMLALMSLSGMASAQAFKPSTIDAGVSPSPNSFQRAPVYLFDDGDTPTMRQQKLRMAIALREDVAERLHRNNGTLTPADKAYIRRKTFRILYGI